MIGGHGVQQAHAVLAAGEDFSPRGKDRYSRQPHADLDNPIPYSKCPTIGVLIHEILPVGLLQCNCSVLGDETSREAIVVDPGDEIGRILRILEEHNLACAKPSSSPTRHIDHIGGAQKLKAANRGAGST